VESVPDAVGVNLEWFQSRFWRPAFTLERDGREVGHIEWRSSFSGIVDAVSAAGPWSMRPRGFLGLRLGLVGGPWGAGAEARLRLRGGARLRLSDGRELQWRRARRFRRSFVWEEVDGPVIMRLRREVALLKPRGNVTVESVVGVEPVALALLGLHLAYRDLMAAAATSA
jgi:hypothetical protein